jgi:hypothetical protein
MDPSVWGPPFWFSIHSVTFTYPLNPDIEDKLRVKSFFNALEFVLPCKICRVHFGEQTRTHPIDNFIHSRLDLVRWAIDLHNTVNVSLGKRIWSYEEVINHFEKYYGRKIILRGGNDNAYDESKLKDYKKRNYDLYHQPPPHCDDNKTFFYLFLTIIVCFLIYFLIFRVTKK